MKAFSHASHCTPTFLRYQFKKTLVSLISPIEITRLHHKARNAGAKAQSHFNFVPGLKAGAPTLRRKRRKGTLLMPGLNKGLHSICYSSCENKTFVCRDCHQQREIIAKQVN